MVISVYFSVSREQYYTVYDFPNDVSHIIGLVDYHNRMFVYSVDLKKLSKNKKYLKLKRYKEPLRKKLGNFLIKIGYKIRDKNTLSNSESKRRFPWWLVR